MFRNEIILTSNYQRKSSYRIGAHAKDDKTLNDIRKYLYQRFVYM